MQIVQIDSVSGEEKDMSNHLVDFFTQVCECKPVKDTYNNVFIQSNGEGEPLLLCAHMDTVEPGRGIVPILKDGTITSSGDTILAADNKAAIAAIMSAVQYMHQHPEQSWRPLDILFTTWEEDSCRGVIGFDRSKIRANIGYIFDGTGEIGDIISASPCYGIFTVLIRGRSAHTENAHEAVPALPTLMEIIHKIEELKSEKVLINIGEIRGGTAKNTIIGKFKIMGEIRSMYSDLFEQTLQKMRGILSKKYDCQLEWEVVQENSGYIFSDTEIEPIKKVLEKLLNRKVSIHQSFGVSDANVLNQDPQKLKVFNLGDGSREVHTTRESTTVENLETMKDLILKLAKNQEENNV